MKYMILFLVSFGWTARRKYPCFVPEKCYCENLSEGGGVELICANIISEDAKRISFDNVTSVRLRYSNFKDLSALRSLKRIVRPLEITIHSTKLDHFSWDWIPANISQITLSGTGITNIYSKKIVEEDGRTEYECKMDHIQKLRRFHIIGGARFKNLPTCLPQSLSHMSFNGVDLSDIANTHRTSDVKWPSSLKLLQFTRNNIKTLPGNIFDNMTRNLTSLFIRHQPISDSRILTILPASFLFYLHIQNTSISFVHEDDFGSFRRHNILTTLALIQSDLEAIPRGLPSSITTLRLQNNKIRLLDVAALGHLKKLEYLNMQRNLILSVQSGLPVSIKTLELDHNMIASCDGAFSKMNNLRRLTLANNSLTSMPLEVPSSVTHYNVANNNINDIGPPANYDFCVKCATFKIQNNPLACNTNMLRFLVWSDMHRDRQSNATIDPNQPKCADGLPGVNNILLENIMKYIRIYSMNGCMYDGTTTLNCTGNGMKELPEMNILIQHVHIADNPIEVVPDFFFASLDSLTILELENAGLTRIPKGLPKSILKLSLARNNLTEISDKDSESLSNLTNLRTLDLGRNRLKILPLIAIQPMLNLNLVILHGNPLDCNCDLWPYSHWSRQISMTNSEIGMREDDGLRGNCATPPSLNGTDVTKLQDYFTNTEVCLPKNCFWDGTKATANCSFAMQMEMLTADNVTLHKIPRIASSGYWREIDLSGLQLKASEVNLSHLHELTTVKLSNNSLNTTHLHGLPHTVTNLTLDHNNIRSVPTVGYIMSSLSNLRTLDLRFNNIRNLSEKDLGLFRLLKTMKIYGNPLFCDCNLRPLNAWISATLDNPMMQSHNLESVTCFGPPALLGKKIMELSEADLCPTIHVGAVVGGTMGGLALIISAFILLIVYWNKRFKIREREAILQGFRDLLQQEAGFYDVDPETGIGDDARFRYDAFLSFAQKEEDEEFATKLLDKLEINHGYKLCVHERDFIPGLGIADNIVECIGASKRIILILSRNFVSSPWCQYEVQVALTELHQKRKSKLLIPILLEDLEDQVEGSVKTFLSLIKGVKIPSTRSRSSWELFWSEILSAMPETPTVDETTV